ncbi:DUF6484 domain-containing protein [Paraburkholderia sp. DHOC27]|uniref:DUF6484 domain-containing protein n=1 Tax=Paraburkholderia sp. DHOC27 TaxID=2303330 RepID=UPI000E3B92ED|nr:DUF6484 domain-containing protein [Paraburkholderia sp. DHOC27]RFU48313.1 hypothetical protein D0B32_00225 [Paraburkholderia sp. DHOC27]
MKRDFEKPVAAVGSVEGVPRIDGVRVGEVVGFAENGASPLVVYPGQPGTAAMVARMIPDLRGAHIGRQVVLAFDGGDPVCPVVMGCLQIDEVLPIGEPSAQVEVDADGQRLVVTAKEEIVLRCGRASITLTKAGRVLIQGTYLSSQASGVNRIKGGSVQLN